MGRLKGIRSLACLLLLPGSIQAQQYVFHAYQQAEGLKNLSVRALATDRSGFLWVGTENGVYRFLGSGFETYGAPQGIAEREIQNVFADPSGGIWAGTYENLYRWDGQRFHPAGRQPIHIWGTHRIAAEDARHLLVVDGNRLYRLEEDAAGAMHSYTQVFSSQELTSNPRLNHLSSVTIVTSVTSAGSQPNGQTIWMGCGKGLCSYAGGHGGTVTEWKMDKGVPEELWLSVVLDHVGTLWAVGQHHVIALPAGASRFVDRKFPDPDPESVYRQIAMIEDRAGRVLVATEEGIARWEGAGWQRIGPANGLRTSHIVDMVSDASGDLWLGSIGHGLIHWIGYENWEGWNDLDGLPSASVWTARPLDPGRVMTGTEKGPAWVDLRNGLAGPLFSGKRWSSGQVSGMGQNPDGSLWAGTFSGAVLRIEPKSGRVQEIAKLPGLILGGTEDRDGRVFFITAAGVYERDTGESRSTPHRIPTVDGILGKSTGADASCLAHDGAVWILANNRLLREQAGQWTEPPIEGLPKLGGPLVALACGADGVLWATGQQSGTWKLTPVDAQARRIKAWQLALPAELETHSPLAIVVDRRGWVWLGTDAGLVAWNGQDWHHLTQESGLIWNDVNQGALSQDPDGSLWVGTSGGLGHLVHPERVFDHVPLDISITDVRRGNAVYPAAGKITLPWSSAPLSLQISSPNTRNRSALTFAYRMEGLQQGWVETRDGAVVFSTLSPGEYTFVAMVRNPSLNASSESVNLRVVILPPWWRSGWMMVVYGAALALAITLFDWIRARNLKRISRQLQRLVAARTSELELSREQLRVQATHDGLTGLLNRDAILRALAAELDRASRERKIVVVALADIDHFKQVNDTHGHLGGDEALRQFAAAMSEAIRPYDHVGRYGGEEFLLILTDLPGEAAEQRLASLHATITNLSVRGQETSFMLTCSIGATIHNPVHDSACDPARDPARQAAGRESLLAVADLALYDAKAQGRNRVVCRKIGVPGAHDLETPQDSSQTV